MERNLDWKKMVRDINKLLQNDFMFDMDCKGLHKGDIYTQEEAEEMRNILMKIYRIAHCFTCTACDGKYLVAPSTE
jgi:hypothetical protein